MPLERYDLFDTLKREGWEFITPDLHSQVTALRRSFQSLRLMSGVQELLVTSRQAATFLQTSERSFWLHLLTKSNICVRTYWLRLNLLTHTWQCTAFLVFWTEV